mgnify:CR=1 FL=1
MKSKVFLGGTCNGSTWRDELEPVIQIDMFNPIVDNWTSECQKREENEKENHCDIHLYVITSQMKGVFSIAEVIDSVHNKEKKTIFHVIPDGFDDTELKSLRAVVDLVKKRGGIAYVDSNLYRTSRVINNSFKTTDFD